MVLGFVAGRSLGGGNLVGDRSLRFDGGVLGFHHRAGRRHDGGDGEVAVGDRALDAPGQLHRRDVQGIADVETGQADLDLVRYLGRVADQLELVADGVQDAAALDAAAFLFAGEANGDVDVHLRMLGDAQEIDMQRPVGDRVELDVLGKGAGGGAAADLDH